MFAGTVCFTFQSDTNVAQVVCRYLQKSDGKYYIADGHTTRLTPLWLDDMECQGSENNLADCSYSRWGNHFCSDEDILYVACYKRYCE